jgi:hypothetical protein
MLLSNAMEGGGTARRSWFEFILERRFASVSVAIRPEITTIWLGTGDHHGVEKRGDEGRGLA